MANRMAIPQHNKGLNQSLQTAAFCTRTLFVRARLTLTLCRYSSMSEIELFTAAASGNAELLAWLLSEGADPNAVAEFGNTLLHNACIASCVNTTRTLLVAGADPNRQYTYRSPVDGRTEDNIVALMKATDADVAALMIDHGADVNLKDSGRSTVLMHAAKRRNLRIARMLLAAGADAATVNNDGVSSLDLANAAHESYIETKAFLRNAEQTIGDAKLLCELLANGNRAT